MASILKELKQITQRSGGSVTLSNNSQLIRFASSVNEDIAQLAAQLNKVYNPLVSKLFESGSVRPLSKGLVGNVIYTNIDAEKGDALVYFDEVSNRPRTIKETIDVLLTEMSDLRNNFNDVLEPDLYDDTELRDLVSRNSLNLEQLKKDTVGDNYTFDADGLADLLYPLAQHIEEIGQMFTGFPGTGLTFSGTYPALSWSVLLSQVTLDTTIPQTTITGLAADLGYIRTFIGMDTTGPETPVYTDHVVSLNYIADGDSLEEAIAKLDDALGSVGGGGAHASTHVRGGSDEINADILDIDYVPANYTRDSAATGVSHVEHLTAHLAGIDTAIGAIAGTSPFATAANVTSNSPGTLATDDFVFGSAQLDDSGSSNHDSRFLFDKSKGAFRAGSVDSTQWDNASRGNHSAAFGSNNTASGSRSFSTGITNIASGTNSSVLGGTTNTVSSTNSTAVGSSTCTLDSTSTVCGVYSSSSCTMVGTSVSSTFLGSSNSTITGGTSCAINNSSSSSISSPSVESSILNSNACTLVATRSAIINGISSSIGSGSNGALILSASTCTISTFVIRSLLMGTLSSDIGAGSQYSAVIAANDGDLGTSVTYSAIIASITSDLGNSVARSVILGGSTNNIETTVADSAIISSLNSLIHQGSDVSVIVGSDTCEIEDDSQVSGIYSSDTCNLVGVNTRSVIIGSVSSEIDQGIGCAVIASTASTIASGSDYCVVLGSNTNTIDSDCLYSVMLGGHNNIIGNDVGNSALVAGQGNEIEANAARSVIEGGQGNTIIANSDWSAILGGQNNTLTGDHSVIVGGFTNVISGSVSSAAVVAAAASEAAHTGALVHGGYALSRREVSRTFASAQWDDDTEGVQGAGSAQVYEIIMHGQQVGVNNTGDQIVFYPMNADGTPDTAGVLLSNNKLYKITASVLVLSGPGGTGGETGHHCDFSGHIIMEGSTPVTFGNLMGTGHLVTSAELDITNFPGAWALRVTINGKTDVDKRGIAHVKVMELDTGLTLSA